MKKCKFVVKLCKEGWEAQSTVEAYGLLHQTVTNNFIETEKIWNIKLGVISMDSMQLISSQIAE